MEQNPLLNKNLLALKIIGLWPPKNKKYYYIYKIYSLVIFFWFFLFTTSQFIEMKYILNDFEEMTTNAGVSLLYTVGIAKVYIVLFKKNKVNDLVRRIQKIELNLLKSADCKLKIIMQEYILQNWGVSLKFWLLAFWTIMGFYIRPSMEQLFFSPEEILFKNGTGSGKFKKPLIFSSWFPFDKYDKNYYLACTLQGISGTFGASYLAIWDTFIVALMIFAIGQFRILQYYLKTIYPLNNQSQIVDEIEIQENFVRCVKHHNLIIQYVKDLDKLISPVMFLDFLVCSLMLCAIGLQATLEGATVKLAFTIEYLIALLIQLFMFYWHANELMLESLKVSDAAWKSNWFNCPTKIQKGLILIVMRAHRPCMLNAGPVYPMNLQTFLMILRASYSYMALLRQVYSNKPQNFN